MKRSDISQNLVRLAAAVAVTSLIAVGCGLENKRPTGGVAADTKASVKMEAAEATDAPTPEIKTVYDLSVSEIQALSDEQTQAFNAAEQEVISKVKRETIANGVVLTGEIVLGVMAAYQIVAADVNAMQQLRAIAAKSDRIGKSNLDELDRLFERLQVLESEKNLATHAEHLLFKSHAAELAQAEGPAARAKTKAALEGFATEYRNLNPGTYADDFAQTLRLYAQELNGVMPESAQAIYAKIDGTIKNTEIGKKVLNWGSFKRLSAELAVKAAEAKALFRGVVGLIATVLAEEASTLAVAAKEDRAVRNVVIRNAKIAWCTVTGGLVILAGKDIYDLVSDNGPFAEVAAVRRKAQRKLPPIIRSASTTPGGKS